MGRRTAALAGTVAAAACQSSAAFAVPGSTALAPRPAAAADALTTSPQQQDATTGTRGPASNGLVRPSLAALAAAMVVRRRATARQTPSRRARGGREAASSESHHNNMALVFVKPHANTPEVLSLVETFLREKGLEVQRRGSLSASDIEGRGIIDSHYAAIAKIGMARDLSTLGLGSKEAEKFSKGYGRDLHEALAAGEIFSAVTAMEVLKVTPTELLSRCLAAGYEKLRSGLYCAKLEGPQDGSGPKFLYVLNGFYARMREKYVVPGVVVNWFLVTFDSSALSWDEFRAKVIGATQPSDAVEGSLRALIRDRWQPLGLKEETNYQDNGVHASAGPLEALRERVVWCGESSASDPFGAALMQEGVDAATVNALIENPEVELSDGRKGSAFDLLEGIDTAEALRLLKGARLKA